ncbi:MAG: cyclic nucleotide-binding domain-containing protein [Actinomycetota bacterium]|nr:cyclic nucleotide-binding domain-containing protein [Actinomycetota bacterium]
MLRKNAKIELLKRVPLFEGCSRRDLAEIASIADEIDLPQGKELTSEGAPGREFFVLIEGDASVKKGNRRINRLSGGDFFGEIALVNDRPRTATVTADTPVRAMVITARNFKSLLQRSPQIQGKVLSAVAARLSPSENL